MMAPLITGHRYRSYNLAPGSIGISDYNSPSQPILEGYDGSQSDIILRLPKGVTCRDLKWLCVWCRKFKANFGEIEIEL